MIWRTLERGKDQRATGVVIRAANGRGILEQVWAGNEFVEIIGDGPSSAELDAAISVLVDRVAPDAVLDAVAGRNRYAARSIVSDVVGFGCVVGAVPIGANEVARGAVGDHDAVGAGVGVEAGGVRAETITL